MRLDLPSRANRIRKQMNVDWEQTWIHKIIAGFPLCPHWDHSQHIQEPQSPVKKCLETKHRTWGCGGAVAAPFVISPVNQIFIVWEWGGPPWVPTPSPSATQPSEQATWAPCLHINCMWKQTTENKYVLQIFGFLPDGKNVIQICLSLCFLPNG